MKKLYVSFLWHMHQPYYKDDLSGTIKMPWVFLHAIKDYYDMPWYIDRFDNIKGTFNLVPSLLVQLKEYEDFHVNDELLNAIRKDVDFLSDEERVYLIEYLFFSNEENCIAPFKRYRSLLEKKRGYNSHEEAAKAFLNSEFLDLEVLFLLSWCGEYLRQNSKIIKSFIKKGENYTHEDKLKLLKTLSEFIKEIVPYYKRLKTQKKIDISTTPFYHPIEPLLFDIKSAKESNFHTPLPKDPASLRDDGILHIKNALSYYQEQFGESPKGFWPAEGSVSYEFLEEIGKRGIKWACSDEEILYKTIKAFRKDDIYKRNRLHFKEGGIYLFFRERTISDLIGFSYSGWEEDKAVDDFMKRLKSIYDNSHKSCNINIILDGENAWEHYKNNAFDFFDKLYKKIEENSKWCECSFFDEVADNEKIDENELYNLVPGSWINGDFRIWIGHEEKNRAWELLFETKRDFNRVKDTFEPSLIAKIEKEFMIAEGSDWFWWYGDDHFTVQKEEFDALFRKHLINIYTLMKMPPPDTLLKSIVKEQQEQFFFKKAKNSISAIIDGKNSNFFEWIGAAVFDLEHELSSMNLKNFVIEKIKFGHDGEFAYFALFGDIQKFIDHALLEVSIDDKNTALAIKKGRFQKDGIEYAADEIIELKIPRKMCEDKKINFKLFEEGKLLQLMPLYSKIKIEFGNESMKNWYV